MHLLQPAKTQNLIVRGGKIQLFAVSVANVVVLRWMLGRRVEWGWGGESSKSVMKKYQFNYFIFVICLDTYVLGFFYYGWLFLASLVFFL